MTSILLQRHRGRVRNSGRQEGGEHLRADAALAQLRNISVGIVVRLVEAEFPDVAQRRLVVADHPRQIIVAVDQQMPHCRKSRARMTAARRLMALGIATPSGHELCHSRRRDARAATARRLPDSTGSLLTKTVAASGYGFAVDQEDPMPKFNFVLLYASDPMASAAFYSKLLGCPPVEASPTFAMLPLSGDVRCSGSGCAGM